MPIHGRLPSLIRLLRLSAALSVMTAIAAVVTAVSGDLGDDVRMLVLVAAVLGVIVLLGMGLLLFAYRQKDKNDSRS